MIKLKSIKLINYCGYRDFKLDLTEDEGRGIRRWAMLYGPNGSFKSTFLRAVALLSNPREIRGGLDSNLFLRRLTYHPNYLPSYVGFDTNKTNLFMEGIFQTDDGDKKIVCENNWDDKIGLTINELPMDLVPVATLIDADKLNSMYKFQIDEKYGNKFLDISKTVYNLKCYLPKESLVSEYVPEQKKKIAFFTDFVITKYGDTLVHYKSFSDGEKKIATLISSLFKKSKKSDIMLIDNIEQHIYFPRHMPLIAKMEEIFPNHQFIATTHSSVIVHEMDPKYLVDMEKNIK